MAARGLERGYRRLLRWYPSSYRGRHEEEILGVLMAAAQPGQRQPGIRESLDLLWSALKIRVRMTLRGTEAEPWAAALALASVMIPLLMVLLKLTIVLDRGAQYGFGSPADILTGAYGEPGTYTQSFQLNPYSVALMGNVTQALTAGPAPALVLAVLALLGWRRSAAAVAAFVPLAYLGIALTSGYTLLDGPRGDVTLYAFGLEAMILAAAPGAARGWRALRWRPSIVLALATVALALAMNGGIWPLLHRSSAIADGAFRRPVGPPGLNAAIPHSFIDRLFGVGLNGWGGWLLYEGTLVAVMAGALATMLLSSPVTRRALILLGVPFAFGAVIYLCSLINPPLPAMAGNALAAAPLLVILLVAIALSVGHGRGSDPGVSGSPASPGGA